MNKLLGYIIAIIGLAIAVLSFNLNRIKIPFLSSTKPAYVMIAGIILVVLGVVLALGKSKAKQAAEEVPIYHKNKIVGYRRGK